MGQVAGLGHDLFVPVPGLLWCCSVVGGILCCGSVAAVAVVVTVKLSYLQEPVGNPLYVCWLVPACGAYKGG